MLSVLDLSSFSLFKNTGHESNPIRICFLFNEM